LSNILDVFLSPQFISPVVALQASQNKLTYAPNQISKFSALRDIFLHNNQIANISSFSFSSPSALIGQITIYLFSNRIASIPPGSFSYPNATSINIYLDSNQITSIPSGIFNYNFASYLTINLTLNNITSLPIKAFTTSKVSLWSSIYLQYNQISTISPGSFQGT
jgi:hypothetical protein